MIYICSKCKSEKIKVEDKMLCPKCHKKYIDELNGVKEPKQRHPFEGEKGMRFKNRFLAEFGECCERCGTTDRSVLQVHHVKPFSKFPHLAYEYENLDVLCKRCNQELGNSGIVDYERKIKTATFNI